MPVRLFRRAPSSSAAAASGDETPAPAGASSTVHRAATRLFAVTIVLGAAAAGIPAFAAHAEGRPAAQAVSQDDMPSFQQAHRAVANAGRSTAAVNTDPAVASRSEVRAPLTAAAPAAVVLAPSYVRPVPGPVTQWYGSHPGIDIAPPYGTPVVAAHAGTVTFAGWQDGYGNHVEVTQDDGTVTTYSHLSAITVTVGQAVATGQQVGNVGSTGWSTGPHLHFEVHLPGIGRTDPAAWLREHGIAV